uniref:Uncharacterized protein n=1 Tax=Mycena chlorophos TaxID=658473 RepID=A0ABQ0LG29_MYCCL|nr:predicted protein [Mycena chlorophos]
MTAVLSSSTGNESYLAPNVERTTSPPLRTIISLEDNDDNAGFLVDALRCHSHTTEGSPAYLSFKCDQMAIELPCNSSGAAQLMDVLRTQCKTYRSEQKALMDRFLEQTLYLGIVRHQLDLLALRVADAEEDITRTATTLEAMGLSH